MRGGSADVTIDNESLRTACAATGGRLLPFFFANPLHGAAAYAEAGGDYFGLKLAPIVHGVPFSDERMHALIDAAEDRSHPIYVHCLPHRGFQVADLAVLAGRHPRAKIILGHGGVGHGDFHGISLIKPHGNVSFEISGSFTHATRIAIQALGAGRVLFGSEYPLQDPRVEMAKLDCLTLSTEDRARIERENILELLGAIPPERRAAPYRSTAASAPR